MVDLAVAKCTGWSTAVQAWALAGVDVLLQAAT